MILFGHKYPSWIMFTNLSSGAWSSLNIEAGLQALSLMLFTNVLGWSAVEVESFLIGVRKDVRNRNLHAYWPV